MHLTKNASKNAGFTLVELIVVITILAILATIAFISYQGYTTDARNAKRSQDINSITSKIGEKRAASQIPMASLTDTSTINNKLDTFDIAGYNEGNMPADTYNAGPINYSILALKQSDFQDPDSNTAYRLGWTTKKGGQFEIAAKLWGDAPKAIVKGTYTNRPAFNLTLVAADINDKTITLPAASGALLFVGDIFSGSSTGSIVAISPDLTRITLDSAPTTGPITMEAESEGLISGSGGTTVVTDGGTEFPY